MEVVEKILDQGSNQLKTGNYLQFLGSIANQSGTQTLKMEAIQTKFTIPFCYCLKKESLKDLL